MPFPSIKCDVADSTTAWLQTTVLPLLLCEIRSLFCASESRCLSLLIGTEGPSVFESDSVPQLEHD